MLAGTLAYAADLGVDCVVAVSSIQDSARIHGGSAAWERDRVLDVFRMITRGSGLALCGGTHLHDEFGGLRLGYHWASLARYGVYFWFARLTGRRTALIGQGVGTVRRRTTRVLAAALLAACHEVTVRDVRSERNLRGLCSPAKVRVGYDLAALMTFDAVRSAEVDWRLAIVPRRTDAYGADYWLSLLCHCIEVYGAGSIVLLPFEKSRAADDEGFVRELAGQALARTGQSVAVYSLQADPRRCLELLSRCAVVVAGRYHAALLAGLLRLPIAVVPYETKLLAIADELNLEASQILSSAPTRADIVAIADIVASDYEVTRMISGSKASAAPLGYLATPRTGGGGSAQHDSCADGV